MSYFVDRASGRLFSREDSVNLVNAIEEDKVEPHKEIKHYVMDSFADRHLVRTLTIEDLGYLEIDDYDGEIEGGGGVISDISEIAKLLAYSRLDEALRILGFESVAQFLIERSGEKEHLRFAGMALPAHKEIFADFIAAEEELTKLDAAGQMRAAQPPLTQDQLTKIAQVAKQHPWSERGDDPRNPFEWVRDFYGEWVGKGLLHSHLNRYDRPLYGTFKKREQRNGLPEWLDVPNESENVMRRMPSPQDRLRVLLTRRLLAHRNQR